MFVEDLEGFALDVTKACLLVRGKKCGKVYLTQFVFGALSSRFFTDLSLPDQ